MLSKSSILHYWSSRFGMLPIVGGKPTFTRNSAGTVGDARGELYDAIINTPRMSWELDKSTTVNERRAALLLELARQNNAAWSVDLTNAVWLKTAVTITAGIADPRGGANASTVTATSASNSCYQQMSAGTSMVRSNAVWIRRRTGTGTVSLLKADGAAYTDITAQLSSSWARLSPALVGASVNRFIGLAFGTSGDAVDVYNFQQEDGTFTTSDVVNTGASTTTRAVDTCAWALLPPLMIPQGLIVYDRFIERGTAATAGAARWAITSAGAASPQLLAYAPSGVYQAGHHNGTALVTSALATAPVAGDTVEQALILFPTGAVQLIQSINGAAVTSSTASGANSLATAWAATAAFYLNSEGGIAVGASASADLRVVKYADVVASTAQGILDEVKAFELNGAGDTI